MGRIFSGCLTRLVLTLVAGLVFMWVVVVALNPWALHIGGRATPLLYWHGVGTVRAMNGTVLPLYVSFWPDRPGGVSGVGRREGRIVSARLQGNAWLCVAPGSVERMNVSGTMYGGYASDANSLLEFRLLEWRRPFAITPRKRGYFDIAGTWHGPDLVMDRSGEQGIPFASGLFIDHATTTLRWMSYEAFETTCGGAGKMANEVR